MDEKTRKERVFPFLNELREFGTVNMFGAPALVQARFGLDKKEAREIVSEWMQTF